MTLVFIHRLIILASILSNEITSFLFSAGCQGINMTKVMGIFGIVTMS
jgi:hypothetical protein